MATQQVNRLRRKEQNLIWDLLQKTNVVSHDGWLPVSEECFNANPDMVPRPGYKWSAASFSTYAMYMLKFTVNATNVNHLLQEEGYMFNVNNRRPPEPAPVPAPTAANPETLPDRLFEHVDTVYERVGTLHDEVTWLRNKLDRYFTKMDTKVDNLATKNLVSGHHQVTTHYLQTLMDKMVANLNELAVMISDYRKDHDHIVKYLTDNTSFQPHAPRENGAGN